MGFCPFFSFQHFCFSGDKYNFARQWKMYCVKPEWFHESLASGYCLPEGDYSMDDQDGGGVKTLDLKRKMTNQKPVIPEWVRCLEVYKIPDIVEDEFLEGCKVRVRWVCFDSVGLQQM